MYNSTCCHLCKVAVYDVSLEFSQIKNRSTFKWKDLTICHFVDDNFVNIC